MRERILLAAILLPVLSTACAGPPPNLFPTTALREQRLDDGRAQRVYDTDSDGRADFAEGLSSDGRVAVLRYDADEDGAFDLEFARPGADGAREWPDAGPSCKRTVVLPADCRHLLIIIDSVPFGMVRDLHAQGRFAYFYPPIRSISPFPVMTDLSLSEFFGVSPSPGVESAYYNGAKLLGGYDTYAHEGNIAWHADLNYHIPAPEHAFAYLWPERGYDHELHGIQLGFETGTDPLYIGYCVGTSAVGAMYGRTGHQRGLIRLDRLCQEIMHCTQGRCQITLMSDHGHVMLHSELIPLPEVLESFGYRVRDRLEKPGDVVVPVFGVVTCAAVHTREPARVARDLIGVRGIDLTAYLDGEQVVVCNKTGRARIDRDGERYRYRPDFGDPLQLLPIIEKLSAAGAADESGFIDDHRWFEATNEHAYPDPLHRLWRAFHGLVEHTPDVLVSDEDGYHCGSPFMTKVVNIQAAHGSLNWTSSSGFCMTTAGELPPVVRMQDLREALRKVGVPLRESPLPHTVAQAFSK